MQNFKRSLGAFLALLTVASTSVQALQTVEPRLTVGGASIAATTQTLPAGSTFSFFGVYGDDSASAESGLGLKVKYNGLHLTNVNITEQYTKCRIAAAQFPAGNTPPTTPTATDQVVMGWIDTAIRPNGVVGTATGAVGWPDLADLGTGGCLNPGSINTDTAAAAPTGLKLFKFTATMAPSCTSAGACTSTVEFNSDGNFSYASATPGMTIMSFNIAGAAAPLATLTKVLSRKVHSTVGGATVPAFDFVLWDSATGAAPTSIASAAPVKTEPRSPVNAGTVGTSGHLVVFKYTAALSGTPTAVASSGVVSSAVIVGDEVQVLLTGIADISRVLITVNGVGDNKSVAMGFLVGNVNSLTGPNMQTNSTDIGLVKGQSGAESVTATNFVMDINANGAINSTDIGLTKGKSGNELP